MPAGYLEHVLCGMLFIARIGDVGTTYLASPTLKFEANPIVRRLGWKYAVLTIGFCVVPYFSPEIGVALLMASLLVSAANASRVWTARTMGEDVLLALTEQLALKSRLAAALAGVAAAAAFTILAGAVIIIFHRSLGFWIGFGVVIYGVLRGLYGSLYTARLFRRARAKAGQVI